MKKMILILALMFIYKITSSGEAANKYVYEEPESVDAAYENILCFVANLEGFKAEAYYDVNRWSIGYGTKSYAGEKISESEAFNRLVLYYDKVLLEVQSRYPLLSCSESYVIACFKYNVSKIGYRLNIALSAADIDAAAVIMNHYVKDANGTRLEGLVNRRKSETELLLNL